MLPQRYSTVTPSSEIQLHSEALTICPKKNQNERHCSYCMMTSCVFSPSASSLMGDYIGMESCFYLDSNQEVFGGAGVKDNSNNNDSGVCSQSRGKREERRSRVEIKREFPPPLPSLARTENMPSHMPWVLQRYYTSDGRLILREEKVRHHEYFLAHRSNGRLTLHLVPLDDNIDEIDENDEIEDHEIDQEEATEEEAQVNVLNSNNFNNNAEDDQESNTVETLLKDNAHHVIEDSLVKSSNADQTLIENGGKCSNYSSARASPTCFLGLPVPASDQFTVR
ncbi:hypothetical protein DITRI_Ditri03aG0158800 [Diplodiscus trichospermus]